MFILLSNDDGYRSPGITTLAKVITEFATIKVVAPDRNRSGASNSLTLDMPIRAAQAENGFYYVEGTPTDCVHLAVTGLFDEKPDMVIGGINEGGNLGDDVLYSGTVAVAIEGCLLGIPAIAISLVGGTQFECAAQVVARLMKQVMSQPFPADTILNVNIPDCSWTDIQGFEITRLGRRHKSEPIVSSQDPRGRPIYWVGPPGSEEDAGVGTDFYAIRMHKVSITPLQVDMTHHKMLQTLENWVAEI